MLNAERCSAAGPTPGRAPSLLLDERLSRGDLLEVLVENDEVFSGSCQVSRDGRLKRPFAQGVQAAGRSTDEIRLASRGCSREAPMTPTRSPRRAPRSSSPT